MNAAPEPEPSLPDPVHRAEHLSWTGGDDLARRLEGRPVEAIAVLRVAGTTKELQQVRRGAIETDHRLVDESLIERIDAFELTADLVVYILDRLLHALAGIAKVVAVAKLDGFILAGRRTAWNCRTSGYSVFKNDLSLDGRIAARIQDLPSGDSLDG